MFSRLQDIINELKISKSIHDKEFRHLNTIDYRAKLHIDDQTGLIIKQRNECDVLKKENEHLIDNVNTLSKDVSILKIIASKHYL